MKQFKELDKLTNKELAEHYIFPNSLTKTERAKEEKTLLDIIQQKRSAQSHEERLVLKLLQLKFQIEDYLKTSHYDDRLSFGYFLKEYIHALEKKNKDFADEINIEPAELSQLINQHRKPNDRIFIRLELHSNKILPAIIWYKLVAKEKEHEIIHDELIRKQERKFVKNKLSVSL